MPNKEIQQILEKYKHRLNEELGASEDAPMPVINTREYQQFKDDILPGHFSYYEKLCNLSERILKIKPDKKKVPDIEESIRTAHLNVTPTGTTSFALLAPFFVILSGIFLSIAIPSIMGEGPSMFFIIFFSLAGVSIMIPLQKLPLFLANSWRLKASNQMVLCIFYIVTYMRHTSNLEHAMEFASNHLSGPLALDLKKVLWDVETEKYATLKESLDNYLETWRKYNMEFVESMHLVESSLYEGSETRRLELLDKSLDVILEETYEKMLHYAQNLKSPITTVYMLGIILPVLGLVILPLMVNFMGGVKWYFIGAIYNIALPASVYFLGKNILASRPTGYGDTDISEEVPALAKFKNMVLNIGKKEFVISPLYICIALGALLFLIAMVPVILHWAGYEDMGFGKENTATSCKKEYCFLTYRTHQETEETAGPFDLFSAVFSLFFPLSAALGIGLYFRIKSKMLMEIRENARSLENEFASALFQLGNRLGDGLPAEVAFEKASDVMEGTISGRFFRHVTINIRKLGMSVPSAIFDPKLGAIARYPSKLIESSMKVLLQAIRKSPAIAAQALINISRYIKEMHRVNERLKDLLADVLASMKSQISLLTPIIAGIVVGITSMITNILGGVTGMLDEENMSEAGMVGALPDLFGIGIPTYLFQLVVGVYVIEIVYILTLLSNGIENGSDKLNEEYMLGKNLIRSGLLYCFIALAIMVIFNLIADLVVANAFD